MAKRWRTIKMLALISTLFSGYYQSKRDAEGGTRTRTAFWARGFSYHYGFRHLKVSLWSGRCLLHASLKMFRREPSRLYTLLIFCLDMFHVSKLNLEQQLLTLSQNILSNSFEILISLSSVLPSTGRGKVSPTLTPFTP
jgi:hypothetical protein